MTAAGFTGVGRVVPACILNLSLRHSYQSCFLFCNMFSMATSAFCYQPKGQHCRTESPNHVLRKIVGRSSPFQQGGWPRVSNAACLGVLRSFDIGISPYYHCVISRQDVTSKKSFYDVNIFLRGFCPSDRRGYIRALCQCNALPSRKSLHNV